MESWGTVLGVSRVTLLISLSRVPEYILKEFLSVHTQSAPEIITENWSVLWPRTMKIVYMNMDLEMLL
jgi:hypothetical protein